MKKFILCGVILFSLGNIAIAQQKHIQKTNNVELVAAKLAKERTEQDTKLYSFTPEQKKKAYDVNLDIGRQLAAAKEQMNDKELIRMTELKRFEGYRTFLTGEQMQTLIKERNKMDELNK
ncbi:MAG: hypothetical protein JSS96_04925 [Bacteroidetes bacterium]|nr:hypothetical protein [Bacteroidota bacterium]